MEVLVNEPIDLEVVADLCAVGMKRHPPQPRDVSRWHVTDLLRAGHSIVKGDIQYGPDDGFQVNGIMSMGKIWQTNVDCYLSHYAVERGGVYVPDVVKDQDGIQASLDGVQFIPEVGWMVCETKLRFSQSEDIPLDHLQQVRAYCYVQETDLVCYVSGHLSSSPPAARARMKIIRLTQQSIEECWQGIVNTRDYLVSLGISPATRN